MSPQQQIFKALNESAVDLNRVVERLRPVVQRTQLASLLGILSSAENLQQRIGTEAPNYLEE